MEAGKLGLFADLLQNEVSNLEIKQNRDGLYSTSRKRSLHRAKATTGEKSSFDVAVGWLKEHGKGKEVSTVPTGALAKALEKAGFSATSVQPLCTKLVAAGHLKRIERGKAVIL